MFTSIFNDVLGPVMRGPSSSHTAGSYHIGLVTRHLLGSEPKNVRIIFDKHGSYGSTYVQQGVDQAFTTGLMGWKQTDQIFTSALSTAQKQGVHFDFEVTTIPHSDHPNFVIIHVDAQEGNQLTVEAKSVGGGTFKIVRVNGEEVLLDGKTFDTLLSIDMQEESTILEFIQSNYPKAKIRPSNNNSSTIQLSSAIFIPVDELERLQGMKNIRQAEPVYYTQANNPLFSTTEEMVKYAHDNRCSLGEAVLAYEKTILGLSEEAAIEEMLRRYSVMKKSVADGLDDQKVNMLLIEAMAGRIMKNVKDNRVAIGGLHSQASAAAMAAMHTCNSQGVVCAAPTGGAAGTLPGVLTALDETYELTDRQIALMMFAAGGIGLILAIRATFAAEVAGCQVEIGAAGAMGSAAVVEFAGGTPQQACDAAAISFQNTMGLVCDLVQGMCELPCHTRNGVAASSAFTNADMVMGGYINHINLDQTIDSVYSSGLMLPSELRCTAKGGLAIAPAAQTLTRSGNN